MKVNHQIKIQLVDLIFDSMTDNVGDKVLERFIDNLSEPIRLMSHQQIILGITKVLEEL